MPAQLHITALGAQGDGAASHEGRTIHVPLTLPGETITAEIDGARARLLSIDTPSPDRAAPKCAHYGAKEASCGGCTLQHLSAATYLAFKRQLVIDALAAQRIGAPVAPVIAIPPRTRRRAAFAAARKGREIIAGFHGRRSHTITPITDCAVLTPGLFALIPKLKSLAAIAAQPKDALTLWVTETDTGADLSITGARKGLSADDKQRLIAEAQAAGLARLSLNGELLIALRQPVIRAGAAFLTPPPGGFLQACAPSESAMAQLVSEAIGPARRVADLFAGAGTFSLRLAASATVHAVESDAPALAALEKSARATPTLKPVTTERRDLFRRPLTPPELKRFDAVVIDPPRAGAEDQTRQLAASSVPRIAMVSCNATTFARDLRILIDGGYKPTQITPIDQFLWSPHIEVVAALKR